MLKVQSLVTTCLQITAKSYGEDILKMVSIWKSYGQAWHFLLASQQLVFLHYHVDTS